MKSTKETFKRLRKNGFGKFLKTTAIAVALPFMISMTAVANDNFSAEKQDPAPQTEHSEYVESLQDRFNEAASKGIDILITDRDKFQIDMAEKDITPGKELERAQLLSEEILEETGVYVDPQFLIGFPSVPGVDSAVTYPMPYTITDENGDSQNRKMCIVMGYDSDMSSEIFAQSFLSMNKDVHGDIANSEIRQYMDQETMTRFVDYHEIGHCMDEYFFTEMYKLDPITDTDKITLNKHKSEVFAEVFSLLIMAQEGRTDHADALANMRLATIAFSGPTSTLMSNLNGGPNMSYVYALHKAIRGTQEVIKDRGVDELKKMSIFEIAELSRDITNQHSFHQEGAEHAISYLLANKFDLSLWADEDFRKQNPHIEERYQIAKELRDDINKALKEFLNLDHLDDDADVLSMIDHDFTSIFSGQGRGQPSFDVEKVTDNIRDNLIKNAGGSSATVESLTKAFIDLKNNKREIFTSENATEKDKYQATITLKLAQLALQKAMDQVAPERAPVQPDFDEQEQTDEEDGNNLTPSSKMPEPQSTGPIGPGM